jgi:hypothetical protein
MTRFAQEIDALALDLAWSLWSELGVDGVRRRHDWQAIDLEPLIIFTSYIGNFDSRLRAKSIDWCIAYARFASAFRLRNLAEQAGPTMRAAFGRYAATVNAHAMMRRPAQDISPKPCSGTPCRVPAPRSSTKRRPLKM